MNIIRGFITGIMLFAFMTFVIALAQTSLFFGGYIKLEWSEVVTGLIALCASGYTLGGIITILWVTKWPRRMTWPVALIGAFALVFATIAFAHLMDAYWVALGAIFIGFVIAIKSLLKGMTGIGPASS